MIFVTVGTHHQAFDRLLGALGSLAGQELVIQYGNGVRPQGPGVLRAEPFLPFDQMMACFEEAEHVVTHAGVGSVICATRAGHVPVVVPRRSDLGEHVDEHQAELTRALAARGTVIAVWETAELAAALAAAPGRRSVAPERPERDRLCGAVRAALEGSGDAEGAQPSSPA